MRKDLLSIQGIDDITADRLGIKDIYDCMNEIEFLKEENERLKKKLKT